MHVGVATDYYLGTVASYVKPLIGLDLGFDVDVRRFNFYLNMMMGRSTGRLLRDIPRDGYIWNTGEKMTGGNMDLSLGYAIIDSHWWKVAPFAGIGVGFLDYPYNPVDPDKDHDEISGFRYLAGVCTDFKFIRNVDFYYPSVSELTVRTRLFMAHTAYATLGPSWSINLGVSINYLGWLTMPR